MVILLDYSKFWWNFANLLTFVGLKKCHFAKKKNNLNLQLQDSSLSLKKGSRREVMLARQEKIKPLGQPGQYDSFPSTSLILPFLMTMNYPFEYSTKIL